MHVYRSSPNGDHKPLLTGRMIRVEGFRHANANITLGWHTTCKTNLTVPCDLSNGQDPPLSISAKV